MKFLSYQQFPNKHTDAYVNYKKAWSVVQASYYLIYI